MSSDVTKSLWQRKGMQQMIKFCLVGATSTVVDKGTLWVLLSYLPMLPWYICQSISFCLAVTNGFIWNRRWTFKSDDHAAVKEQYPKFVATNIVGLILNLSITKFFLILITGEVLHKSGNPDKMHVILASFCAIPIVVFWNFAASKYWTFRAPKPTPS